MVRATVERRRSRRAVDTRRVGEGPIGHAEAVPPLSVLAASALALLPVVTQTGLAPDFGFVLLLAWRLLRADVWPAWWGAPLGLVNDLLTGTPIGSSMTIWTAALLALDLLEQRIMWRDYWLNWLLAAVLIAASETVHWRIDKILGAELPFSHAMPQIVAGILLFPFAAWLCATLDRWRLGV